uniref:UspA domain-containing protein n=1 Tax=Ananas comosus var. bracteatus TaxID=296719 RepID=A0A6V7P2R2_ANACO|nr:unnamed protein product [Ananas comosus var. bracteatus]
MPAPQELSLKRLRGLDSPLLVDDDDAGGNAASSSLRSIWCRRRRRRDPGVLIILHVQPAPSIATSLNPGSIPFGGRSGVDVPAFSAAIEAHQRRITDAILKHALDICADRNVNVRTEVVVGDPKVKICEATVNLHADLLVMGCRSMGTIKRMFLGSVSNYCINHVSCPVLVIRGT